LKNEPEIIADVPFRIEPEMPLPVLLIVKHANKYPIQLLNIEITIKSFNYNKKYSYKLKKSIKNPYWYTIFYLEIPNLRGRIDVDVKIKIMTNQSIRSYHNDNYTISSHTPFRVVISSAALPKRPNWYYGDLHVHSSLTDDQVEFGAPISAIVELAKTMGIHFIGVADHSYDLDDRIDNYLQNDPELPKWNALWKQTSMLGDQHNDFVILPGEEVSVGNRFNQNVHLLVFNNPKFIPGSGDSAEKWFKNNPDLNISTVLRKLCNQSVAFAAHPVLHPPFLQKLLIKRGVWSTHDLSHSSLNGMQVWNGRKDKALRKGVKKWVSRLLDGQKISIVAGNDSHGNFNRFRQIGIPFWTLRENRTEIFGRALTGVQVNDKFCKKSLLKSIQKGKMIVTDGPFAKIEFHTDERRTLDIGDTLNCDRGCLWITVLSNDMFGKIKNISICIGNILTQKETLTTFYSHTTEYHNTIHLNKLPQKGYIRAEVYTQGQQGEHLCLTNPIYINNM
jgi:hypothetical protein